MADDCSICGYPLTGDATVGDHVLPLSRGGADTAENIAPAHATCNSRKGSKLMDELPADRSLWRFTNHEVARMLGSKRAAKLAVGAVVRR